MYLWRVVDKEGFSVTAPRVEHPALCPSLKPFTSFRHKCCLEHAMDEEVFKIEREREKEKGSDLNRNAKQHPSRRASSLSRREKTADAAGGNCN